MGQKGTGWELKLQPGDIVAATEYTGPWGEHECRMIAMVLRGPFNDTSPTTIFVLWSDPTADRHNPERVGSEMGVHSRFNEFERLLTPEGILKLGPRFEEEDFIKNLIAAFRRCTMTPASQA